MKLERILLPTDLSELSAGAAEVARSLAQASGATVHVLHVRQPIEVTIEVPEAGILRRKVPADEAELERRLDEFVRRHFDYCDVPTATTLTSGKPGREIARVAHERRVDRIVIGTHARGVLRQICHGSVSKYVLAHAPCPVLMVPPPPHRRARSSAAARAGKPAFAG